jgi:hypothetical protein
MSGRGVLLLAGAFAVLCAAYFGAQYWQARQTADRIAAKNLFAFPPEAVRAVEVQQVGAPAVAGERAEGGWRILRPNATIPANALVWDRVAKTIAELRSERTLAMAAPEDRAAFGLDTPVLTVKADAGDRITLEFGNLEPTQQFRYALLNGETLFLAENKRQYFELNRSLDDLRDRFLVNDRNAPLLRMEFARIHTGTEPREDGTPPPPPGTESVAVVVARDNAEAPWRMLAPVDAPADEEAVNALAVEIQSAVGRDFIDAPEALEQYGLEPAAARLSVSDTPEGKAQTIYFGHLDKTGSGGVFVKRADRVAVFKIDPNVLTLFPRTPSAFRQRHLLTLDIQSLRELRVAGAQGDFTLQKDESGPWRMTDPPLADLDQQGVSNYLAALKRAAGEEFHAGPLAAFGLDAPDLTITLITRGDETRSIRLRRAAELPDRFYAQQDSGGVVSLPSSQAAGFLIAPDQLRSRRLLRFDAAQAARLAFSLEGAHYVFVRAHDKWIVEEPSGHYLENQSDAARLVEKLSNLHAAGDRPAPPEAATGLDTPMLECTVTLRPEAGEQPQAMGPLRVGAVSAEDSRRRYASVPGRDGAFLVDQGLIEAFRDALRGVRPAQ